VFTTVCLESGELATEHCTRTRLEVFREETEPTISCQMHAGGRKSDGFNRRKDDKRIHF